MRDPGPARSSPALLCSTRWLTHSLQITENRAELPAISPSTQSRHLLSLFIPSSYCSSKGKDSTKAGAVQRGRRCGSSLKQVLCSKSPGRNRLHLHFIFVGVKKQMFNFSLSSPSFFCGWCTPVFVFRQEEAPAASLSTRLFLKDMRSYPAQPFPFC